MAEFSKTKKQGKGVEHTKIYAVNIRDYSSTGKKTKKYYEKGRKIMKNKEKKTKNKEKQ